MSDFQRPRATEGVGKVEAPAELHSAGGDLSTERTIAARQIQRSMAAWGSASEAAGPEANVAPSPTSNTSTVMNRLRRLVKRRATDAHSSENGERVLDGAEVNTINRMPKWTGGDGEDDGDPRNARGAKGESFRGGKKKDRDQWFGLEAKPDFEEFQRWWHRVGKQGKDLTSKADADQAYAAFKADKTKPK